MKRSPILFPANFTQRDMRNIIFSKHAGLLKAAQSVFRLVTIALFCQMIFLVVAPDESQANPLTGKRTERADVQQEERATGQGAYSDLIAKITVLQMQLKQKIAKQVRGFKVSGDIAPLLPLFFFSFLYGILHAVGPGHGKTIAMSYTLSRGTGYKSGLLLGTLIGIVHAGSAIIIVFSLRYLFEAAIHTSLDSATQATQVFSYCLISLIGVYLFVTGLYALFRNAGPKEEGHHGHRSFTNPFMAALAIGIIPCPGVIMILLFCISLEQVILGLLLCLAVSIGMALTISCSVWISITGKKVAILFTGKTQRGLYYTENVFSMLSGLILAIMGGLFLVVSLG